MKKYLTIMSIFAAGFVFADDENYDGKSVSEDFSGKSMNYSSWIKASASYAKFVGTKLREANFSNATLCSGRTYTDFSNADLRDSIFDNAILSNISSHAKFDGANIKGASFKNVTFAISDANGTQSIDFTNSDLTNVDFTGSIFCSASTYQSKYSASKFKGATFYKTNFTNCVLSIPSDYSSISISVDFSNLDVSTCIFDGAVLSSAGRGQLNKPFASSVSFTNAKVAGASFKGAILAAAQQDKGELGETAVDFSNLDLSNCNFSNAKLSAYAAPSMSPSFSEVSASVNMSGCKLVGAIFDGATLSASSLSGVDFSNADLTGANFINSKFDYASVKLDNTIISNVNFSNATGLTTSQLSQTASYKNKDLSGIKFNGIDLTNWILRGQNLQNTSFNGANLTGVNARYADLRGADLTGITGSLKTQNTIWTDGEIKNFSMESVDDSLSIRAYVPATSGGEMINAKIADDATISGGAVLTLEEGAILEIMAGKTLTVAGNSEIIFNVDVASDNTKILLNSGSTIAFGADSKVMINLDGVISPDDSYAFSVIEAAADACISGADAISKDNLVLNVNGEAYDSDKWGFNFDPTTGALTINVNVPEPATVAAIFGAVALAFAVYRRRK